MIKYYKRRSNVVEAARWDGKNFLELSKWANTMGRVLVRGYSNHLILKTIDGNRLVSLGNWIIKNRQHQFFVCRYDLFQNLYDPVDYDDEVFTKIEKKKQTIARLRDEIYK